MAFPSQFMHESVATFVVQIPQGGADDTSRGSAATASQPGTMLFGVEPAPGVLGPGGSPTHSHSATALVSGSQVHTPVEAATTLGSSSPTPETGGSELAASTASGSASLPAQATSLQPTATQSATRTFTTTATATKSHTPTSTATGTATITSASATASATATSTTTHTPPTNTPAPTLSPTVTPWPATAAPTAEPPIVGRISYYVDCASGSDSKDGRTPATAWQTIGKVNSRTFEPGDSILFKRGVTCAGMLQPAGSGVSGSPITLDAYGTGPLPIINGGDNTASLRLINPHYWRVQNLEFVGGNPYGIYITSSRGGLSYLRLVNLSVHDVKGVSDGSSGGLIVLYGNEFNDVVIDGITAHSTGQWTGITVWTGTSSQITIRNSVVHDVAGDGILLLGVSDALIEKNLVYNTGFGGRNNLWSPGGLWTSKCIRCVSQLNEVHSTRSPTVDGGAFDMDIGAVDNVVQYNYGHDAQGACISIFSGQKLGTIRSVARYNLCVNNQKGSDFYNANSGGIWMTGGGGGYIDGVLIYNNTIYHNPASNFYAVSIANVSQPAHPNIIANNLIYSTVPKILWGGRGVVFDHNLYWYTGSGPTQWSLLGHGEFNSFAAYQSGTGFDRHGLFADPHLNLPADLAHLNPSHFSLRPGSPAIDAGMDIGNMGGLDLFNNPAPNGAYDIGAIESP